MTEQERAEALLDLFLQPGWKILLEEVDEIAASLDCVIGIADAQELHTRQGKLQVLNFFLTYEQTLRRLLDEETL